MFVHLTKRTKFLVLVRLFHKRTNTNELLAERFTNYSPNVWFVYSPTPHYFLRHPGEGRIRVAPVRLGWDTRFYRYHCRAFGRVEVGFPCISESQGASEGRVVDLDHSARCHDNWHVVSFCS
ncbi:hypothetical protein Hanom_Chr11g00977491 [Helianthus anomalus]